MGTESGLLSEEVYKVFQDGQGYVWALTDYGPQRHNGRRFEMVPGFSASDSPYYNYIIDRQKQIWLYNAKGEIGLYKDGRFEKHRISDRLAAQTAEKNSLAFNLKEGQSGQMYFESFRNLVAWDRNKRLDTLPEPEPNAWTVRRIDGQWLTNREKLQIGFLKNKAASELSIPIKIYDFRPEPVVVRLPFKSLSKYRLMASEGPEGLLVTVGSQAILLRRNGQIEVKSYPFSIIFNKWINHRFHLGFYNAGLARLDTDLENLNFLVTDASVSDAWSDLEGHLWVSSLERGIFHQKETGWESLRAVSGRTSMLKPLGSTLMVGTENGELFQIDQRQEVKNLTFPGQRSSKVLDLLPLEKDYLLGTHSGVFRWDGNKGFNLIREEKTDYLTIGQYICRLPDGKILLSYSLGLMEFNGQTLRLLPNFPYKVREVIYWNDLLWLATDDGLNPSCS